MRNAIISLVIFCTFLNSFSQISMNSYSFADTSGFKQYDNDKYQQNKYLGNMQEVKSLDLSNSINEETYFIGSGDCFKIVFPEQSIEQSIEQLNCIVDQNKDLIIPGIGLVELNKVNIIEAKKKILTFITSKTKRTLKVSISLANVKNVTIYVAGSVLSPGRYVLSGTIRLLDVLKIANNNTIPSYTTCNFRSVKCVSTDTTKYYDLFKYIYKGDMSENPYIYPGDEISFNPPSIQVQLNGEVKPITGLIPILPNETLKDFLSLFILNTAADTNSILIQRIDSYNIRTLDTIKSSDNSKHELMDNDIIIVPRKKNYPEILMVTIDGEISKPGSYPISHNSVTANEIIKLAGGITPSGNLSRAIIIRNSKYIPEGSNSISIRPEINSAISMMNKGKDYLVIHLSEKDVFLKPTDQIFIPKAEEFIHISGSVKSPGALPYTKDKGMNYYLRLAGGLSKKADKKNITVISTYGKVVQLNESNVIQEGDVIVVPISQQNKKLTTVILPIIQVVATTLSVLLGIYVTVRN